MKINVLDKGYVELIDSMGDDMSPVEAARTSFKGDSKGEEKDTRLLHFLKYHHHDTPFEMVQLKFKVKLPTVVAWQWVRHRAWSYNFSSGRYTEFEPDEFYIPTIWRKQSKSNKQGSSGEVTTEENKMLTNALKYLIETSYNLYKVALKLGVAKEMARFFLPAWLSYYTMICSVDMRNLMHFLELRNAPDAQHEIRQYAQALDDIVREKYPKIYAAYTDNQYKQ